MDLVYMPEVFIYGSFRSPQYRDYELSWNKEYLHNKKSSQTNQWQRYPSEQPEHVTTKETCHLCRETKRRSLAAYIRSKSRSDSNHGIHEEEEEEEAGEEVTMKERDNGKKAVNADKNKSAKISRDEQERK